MPYELMLLRHGKSDWSVATGDFDRPLTQRGKRGAKLVGCWLRECGAVPDCIITSPAIRARSTAHKCAQHMGVTADSIVEDRRIYGAGVTDLLAVLHECPSQVGRVMLVGHNPGLETMVEYLAADEVQMPQDGKLMPTATLAWFNLGCDWKDVGAGCASLKSITRPTDIQ